MKSIKVILILLFQVFVFQNLILAIPPPTGTTIKIYSDGYAYVEQVVKSGRLETIIRLLGEPEYLIVKDEEGLPLDYKLNNKTLVIFSVNSSYVYVSYYTAELTEKKGALWRIYIKVYVENITVILPENAVLVNIDPLPSSVKAINNTLYLTFETTPILIEYTLTPRRQPTTTQPKTERMEKTYDMLWFLTLPVIVVISIIIILIYNRRTREELDEEEKRIVEFLKKRKRAYLTEIASSLNIPKTTAWRKIRRLEEKKIIRLKYTSRGLLIQIK